MNSVFAGCKPRRQSPTIRYGCRGMKLKKLILILLLSYSCNAMAEWVVYSERTNGDVYFYDKTRVQKQGNLVNVWSRIRYKTSVMGASSYQSFIEIDCSEYSETTLQRTFYSDNNWTIRAMATDMTKKPKVTINANSASERLADILCKQ